MFTKELSALVSMGETPSAIKTFIMNKMLLEITEETELDCMHIFLKEALSGERTIKDAEAIYGPNPCELLTKDQADRFVFDYLTERKLDIGQSVSNLLSENRRIPLTERSFSKAQIKGNRHKYGACPYNEGRPLSYFKTVLFRWLEENVKPEAKVLVGARA